VVATASGPGNYDFSTNVYDNWSPISVTSPNGSDIVSITISGRADFTGIDNLDVCQVPVIDSVEITQAIQQYQTLTDLQKSLASNGEPPVPIISGKPAVLRAYFQKVQDATNVTVRLSGVSGQTKSLVLQPNCADADQRAGNNGCPSMDFYFTPPTGNWQAVLDILDGSGNVLKEYTLDVISRDTNGIRLKGVTVCDSPPPATCGQATSLLGMSTVLSRIAPTDTVIFDATNNVVSLYVSDYLNAGLPINPQQFIARSWWGDVVRQINSFYGLFDFTADSLAGLYTTYFGMIRPNIPNSQFAGLANGIPSHGAAALTSSRGLNTSQTIAHEAGHTLGLKHTNVSLPPGGCYALAYDPSTDWPYATNYLQSGPAGSPQMEIGFDVPGHTHFNPNNVFELMGYCFVGWTTPQRYNSLIATLGGGQVISTSAAKSTTEAKVGGIGRQPMRTAARPQKPVAKGSSLGPFWLVSGTIQSGSAVFDPLFQLTIQGNSTDTGPYSLVVEDSAGQALFTQPFTPTVPPAELPGSAVTAPPSFSETLPVTANASAIILNDDIGTEIGAITLGGASPAVTVTFPTAGTVASGIQNVSWTVVDPGQPNLWAMILYSADNGATWANVASTQNQNSMQIDFDTLPGTAQALIQVIVSDGINSGSATSPPFTVPKKTPSLVTIDTPAPNASQPAADPLYLSGTAYDVDDGVLSGTALAWSSNIQGALGTGSPLSVQLQPGIHTIQLTATDSDGNSISTSTAVTIGGQPPVVSLQTGAVDLFPTTCEGATVAAQPGASGAPLSSVQVSFDGGATYNSVPQSSLPYTFIAPGSGFIHLVARAYDSSGQSSAADATFLTAFTCQSYRCDPNLGSAYNVSDVQQMMNEVLGSLPAIDDLDGNGVVNVADAQIVMNAVLYGRCTR
jgi:hypothetical protein